jgi:hypothetical protein
MLVKDMFEKNGHNPSCGFAGDIVSYLYDETSAAEKAKFEMHLAGCTACGDELAAFSSVRTSISDWREADFGWLPTPDIVIPYETLPAHPPVVETRGTILTDLKRLFSFTPWPPAIAAFGALAVVAGLALFAIGYLNKPETNIADNRNSRQPAASPTVNVPQKATTAAIQDPPVKQGTPDKLVTEPKETRPEVVNASAPVPARNKKAQPVNDVKNADKPDAKAAPANNQKAPSLNNYTDEEDTTLRLADLFEEIDTKE